MEKDFMTSISFLNGCVKHIENDGLLVRRHIEDDKQVYLMSDLLEGLTVIRTTVWWLQNVS
jgi:hypothetical protein